jgi:YD repeat-containing protein
MKSKPSGNEGRFAYDGLDRVIHERARLSILTSLVTNPKGLTFNDLPNEGERGRWWRL